MRILAVADLHYNLPQFDWLVSVANRYDLLIIAGDLLDGGSFVTASAQMVVVLKYLERLRAIAPLVICSGNHDLNNTYSTGERYARWVPYARGPGAHADNETFAIGEDSITICPWWDGDIARRAIGRELAEAATLQENSSGLIVTFGKLVGLAALRRRGTRRVDRPVPAATGVQRTCA